MQIQLKQPELEIAVRDYIAKMGISEALGSIKFTSERNPAQILTEIQIGEDVPIAKATSTTKVPKEKTSKTAAATATKTSNKEPEPTLEAAKETAAVEEVASVEEGEENSTSLFSGA